MRFALAPRIREWATAVIAQVSGVAAGAVRTALAVMTVEPLVSQERYK